MLDVEVDLVGDLWSFAGCFRCLSEVEERRRADEENRDEESLKVCHCEEFNRHSVKGTLSHHEIEASWAVNARDCGAAVGWIVAWRSVR